MGGRGQEGGLEAVQKIEEECVGMITRSYGPFMSQNWLKWKEFTAQVFGQHHGAAQPHIAIPRLTIAPLRPHTTNMDHHWAWEKQTAKADHSSLVDSDCEI